MTRSEHKSRRKRKPKAVAEKKNTRFLIRMKTRALLANEKQGNFSKGNLLGSNHLLQQTKLN
jgi:hypothetical protein